MRQDHQIEDASKRLANLIPMPASIKTGEGSSSLSFTTEIDFDREQLDLVFVAHYLREFLSTLDLDPNVTDQDHSILKITLQVNNTTAKSSLEAYRMNIGRTLVTLSSPSPGGLYRGVQTLIQLAQPVPGSSTSYRLPHCEIRDEPRFAWRGMMLDVARHFFSVSDVKRVIDLITRYKFNRLHLHLTDDQGWRIEIKSWPKLTQIGGSTKVGGGNGGFFTQEEYSEVVTYAQDRYITIVPEIDMPGHTNAALASYPELNADGVAPGLYTGTGVGFSSLAIDKPVTYQFISDVLAELADMTPGPYLHIGGDEAKSTPLEQHKEFIETVQQIVTSLGKQMIGWQEISHSRLTPGSIVQYWTDEAELGELPDGVGVIMSPACRAYLDMKYCPDFPLGLEWAGFVNVQDAFTWDPETYLNTIKPGSILGVEAPLWSETIQTVADIECMMFPRILGISEIGWSQNTERDFNEFRERLAFHGRLLDTLNVNYYRSKQIKWM